MDFDLVHECLEEAKRRELNLISFGRRLSRGSFGRK